MSFPHFDIHDDREQNKLGLETYFLDKKNIYDVAIDKQIDELKTGVSKLQQQFAGWNHLKDNDPERYKELAEQAERSEINNDLPSFFCNYGIG